MAAQQDTVVVRPQRRPNPARTLVCLGFCGGGTGPFHPWSAVVPADVDVAAICYPGREGRFAEPYAADWDALAEDTANAVRLVAEEGPYVLFGHSMGGWMAFDVTVRLQRDGGPLPEALVVSSANAPSRGLTPQDMFPNRADTDEQLVGWMRTHGLMPGYVLDDPDLRDMALDLMRADIRVRDTFRYTEGRISVPLQAITADDDAVMEPNVAEQWAALADGGYRHDQLTGGHFYTPEIWSRLPVHITALSGPVRAAFT